MTREMGKILFRMFATRVFCTLTPQERDAVTEAIRIAVVTRGTVSENVRRETRSGILSLPWAWEPSFARDIAVERKTLDLSHVEDPTVLTQLSRALAHSLPRPDVRERLFRAMLALLFADGGSERDLSLLEPVRDGFQISTVRGDEILEDLKDELVSIVS